MSLLLPPHRSSTLPLLAQHSSTCTTPVDWLHVEHSQTLYERTSHHGARPEVQASGVALARPHHRQLQHAADTTWCVVWGL
jgi:hypothetical protein